MASYTGVAFRGVAKSLLGNIFWKRDEKHRLWEDYIGGGTLGSQIRWEPIEQSPQYGKPETRDQVQDESPYLSFTK